MNRLIVNALPKDSPAAQTAIEALAEAGFVCRVIDAYEKNFRPCVGCNACWLKTPSCCYGGTLIKGDMFGLGLMDEKNRAKVLAGFTEMGRCFAKSHEFDEQTVRDFSGPEYMAEKEIRMFNRFGRPVQRIFMGRMAKKMGCKERLDAKPYADWLKTAP